MRKSVSEKVDQKSIVDELEIKIKSLNKRSGLEGFEDGRICVR